MLLAHVKGGPGKTVAQANGAAQRVLLMEEIRGLHEVQQREISASLLTWQGRI